MSDHPEPLRPRDFALLLLGSGDVLPRQRARDQQADRAGLDLKRRVLNELVARDPEPDELEAVLMDVVEQIGPPTGPTRSVAALVLDEWRTAVAVPGWVAHLLGEALRPPRPEGRGHGRELPA
jgi:hypothetical protein